MKTEYNPSEYLHKDKIFAIIGICMAVHRTLGHGFLEIVYKDAIEIELRKKPIEFCREKDYNIDYNGIILPYNFYADFVLFDKIILEVKTAKGGLADDQIARTINYLKVSGCKIGLLVNFGRGKLKYRRLIF